MRLPRNFQGLLVALLAFAISACANSIVSHGFEFEGFDSPGIRVLDYRYGDSRQPSARAPAADVAADRVLQAAGVRGEMLRGDYLYVKWRVKSNGVVYERTVDLKSRLPRDIEGKTITFQIQEMRLQVFLATWERRPPGMPAIGPKRYLPYKVFLIAEEQGFEVSAD